MKSLVTFERRLSALNGRRQRAQRVLAPLVAAKFSMGDFFDIDQAATTATVRADARAVTLRERQTPALAVVRTKRFAVTTGVAEGADPAGNLYRVHTDDATIPVGTFDLELVEPLTLTMLIFDLAAMPSAPNRTTTPPTLTSRPGAPRSWCGSSGCGCGRPTRIRWAAGLTRSG